MRWLLGAPHRRPPLRLRGVRSWAGVLRLRMDRVGRRRRPARVRRALFAGTASVFRTISTTPERAGLGAASACPARPSPSIVGPSTAHALIPLRELARVLQCAFPLLFSFADGMFFYRVFWSLYSLVLSSGDSFRLWCHFHCHSLIIAIRYPLLVRHSCTLCFEEGHLPHTMSLTKAFTLVSILPCRGIN